MIVPMNEREFDDEGECLGNVGDFNVIARLGNEGEFQIRKSKFDFPIR